jgi:hypothetical protein
MEWLKTFLKKTSATVSSIITTRVTEATLLIILETGWIQPSRLRFNPSTGMIYANSFIFGSARIVWAGPK